MKFVGILIILTQFIYNDYFSSVVEAASSTVYVSALGDDSSTGEESTPFKTLNKAYEEVEEGGNIVVLSDLEMKAALRINSKSVILRSKEGEKFTLKRMPGFETISDTASSWYNPAMIEFTSSDGNFTIQDLILDDQNLSESTDFSRSHSQGMVQDGIIATYAGKGTLTLENVDLLNPGGQSALVAFEKKTKYISGKIQGGNKANGTTHINISGTNLTIGKDVRLTGKTIGGAVRADYSTIHFDGEISDNHFVGDEKHIAQAFNLGGSTLILEKNSKITRNTSSHFSQIYTRTASTIVLKGEISYNTNLTDNGGAIYLIRGANLTIEPGAKIIGNKQKETNYRSGGAGIYATENSIITMKGGEISGNSGSSSPSLFDYFSSDGYKNTSGGAISLSRGAQFIMNGGMIKENTNYSFGGGIALSQDESRNGKIELNGGTIEKNTVKNTNPDKFLGNDLSLIFKVGDTLTTNIHRNKIKLAKEFKLEEGLAMDKVLVNTVNTDVEFGYLMKKTSNTLKDNLKKQKYLVNSDSGIWIHTLNEYKEGDAFLLRPLKHDLNLPNVYAVFAEIDPETGVLLDKAYEFTKVETKKDDFFTVMLPKTAKADSVYAVFLVKKPVYAELNVNKNEAHNGEELEYRATIHNISGEKWENKTVTITLPEGIEIISNTSQIDGKPIEDVSYWKQNEMSLKDFNLDASTQTEITFRAKIKSNVKKDAVIKTELMSDDSFVDPAYALIKVLGSRPYVPQIPFIHLNLSVNKSLVKAGEMLEFTITAKNEGWRTWEGKHIIDQLDLNVLEWLPHSTKVDGVIQQDQGIWNNGILKFPIKLKAGEVQTISFSARVKNLPSGTVISNTVFSDDTFVNSSTVTSKIDEQEDVTILPLTNHSSENQSSGVNPDNIKKQNQKKLPFTGTSRMLISTIIAYMSLGLGFYFWKSKQ